MRKHLWRPTSLRDDFLRVVGFTWPEEETAAFWLHSLFTLWQQRARGLRSTVSGADWHVTHSDWTVSAMVSLRHRPLHGTERGNQISDCVRAHHPTIFGGLRGLHEVKIKPNGQKWNIWAELMCGCQISFAVRRGATQTSRRTRAWHASDFTPFEEDPPRGLTWARCHGYWIILRNHIT